MAAGILQLRRCPFTVLLLASVAVGAALYVNLALSEWAERTERDLTAFVLVRENAAVTPEKWKDQLQADEPHIRRADLIGPDEIANELKRALREAGTTAPVVQSLPRWVAIEISFRGSVTNPGPFAATLKDVQNHPVFRKMFFDSRTQASAARFYSISLRVVLAYLALAVLISILAIAGASGPTQRPDREGGLPPDRTPSRSRQIGSMIFEFLRTLTAAAIGWLCLFLILLIWQAPAILGLGWIGHTIVLVETVVLIEFARLCGWAISSLVR
jgi:hypothetical protein